MKRTAALPELLAPAGSPDALYAAIEAGADAVYLGVSAFNARANAANFTQDELSRALSYCRLRGRKVHITLNTLLFDREINDYLATVAQVASAGADAVIVADAGAISLIHEHFPELEIHASTQLSVHSTEGAALAERLGAKRAVLARELSLDDMRSVTERAPIETEVFVHGALCVSHSGQCLFSSIVGGRSGNRGECAQPCRLPYSGGYPLSLKDLCLAPYIPDLIESGVASLKIEGRMKSPDYVYGTTAIYRRLLDEGRSATDEELDILARIFSRDGFTDGYFAGNKFGQMNGIRREEDKLHSVSKAPSPPPPSRIPITATAKIRAGQPSGLTLSCGSAQIEVEGATPSKAISAPLTPEGVTERLCKLGGTFFSLSPKDVALELDSGLNLSPGAINDLRRRGVAALIGIGTKEYEPISVSQPELGFGPYTRTAVCRTAEQYRALKASGFYDAVYLPLDCAAELSGEVPDGIIMPPVVFDSEEDKLLTRLSAIKEGGVTRVICSNLGQASLLIAMGFEVMGDLRLNITNSYSAAFYQRLGLRDLVLSPELSLPRLRDIPFGRTVVYGRLPLMLLERCVTRTVSGCPGGKCTDGCKKSCEVVDRRGAHFPILPEEGHRNSLYNCIPTYMGDKADQLRKYSIKATHFIFTVESPDECLKVTEAYRAGQPLGRDCRRIQS